jgi:hypothetical protein
VWRRLPNGTLAAPRRGTPPPAPVGYQATRDPFVAVPILKVCEHRFETTETLSCGKILKIIECSYFNKNVETMTCFKCEVPNGQKMDSKSN